MSSWIILILILLNALQMLFWGYQCQRLINKVMSRNYAEYDLIVNGPREAPPKKEDPISQQEEQEILDELNGLFKPMDRTA